MLRYMHYITVYSSKCTACKHSKDDVQELILWLNGFSLSSPDVGEVEHMAWQCGSATRLSFQKQSTLLGRPIIINLGTIPYGEPAIQEW